MKGTGVIYTRDMIMIDKHMIWPPYAHLKRTHSVLMALLDQNPLIKVETTLERERKGKELS